MSSDSSSLPPDADSLHQAALNYLARYAASEADLRRVLNRRIDRWTKGQADPDSAAIASARSAIFEVVIRLVQSGALNDADFAAMRAKSLVRGGQSRRSVEGRLRAKGVAADIAQAVVPDDPETELAAALVMARRRRIGPFRLAVAADAAMKRKELGRMARAGFAHETAQRALEMTAEEADHRIQELRR